MSEPSRPLGTPRVACVIPAHNEADRVADTVAAVSALPAITEVVVVDDGSTDDTWRIARDAGARVHRHLTSRGKAAAMTGGADLVRRLPGGDSTVLLFLDADLGASAAEAGALITPVAEGRADMTIATLPAQTTESGAAAGGHGFVVRTARAAITRYAGWTPSQPLSGQRCLTPQAYAAARPLAAGFGVETALSMDLGRAGFRILEVPAAMTHRASGGDWRAQLHRGRQFADVLRAAVPRLVRPARRRTRDRSWDRTDAPAAVR